MKKKIDIKDIFSIIIPLLMGVISLFVWRNNVSSYIDNYLWLINDLYVVRTILIFTTISYLNAFVVWKRINIYIYLLCFCIIYASSWLGYYLCKKLFFLLYDRAANDDHIIYVWLLIIIVGLISLVFYMTINYFIRNMRPFHVFTFIAVFISVIPASLITIDWLSDHSNLKTFLNSIKLGYPIFWINILLGWTTYALTKKMI